MSAAELTAFRHAFPITRETAYLSCAHRGALPARTLARLATLHKQHASVACGAIPEWFETYQAIGARLAGWLGAEPDQLAFMPNTTHAIATVANGFDWAPGDQVVIPSIEFPANVYPWMQLSRWDVSVKRVDPDETGRVSAEQLLGAITPRTRMVAASLVSFHNGYRLDVAALAAGCRERGVYCVIDAAQAVGWLGIDFNGLGVDALAGDSRKFFCGLDGLGFLVLRPEFMDLLHPSAPGAFSVKQGANYLDHRLDYRDSAHRFMNGALGTPQVYGLGESLALLASVGRQAIEERVMELSRYAYASLAGIGLDCVGVDWRGSERSALLSVRFHRDGLKEALADAGVVASVRPPVLRISVHAFNDESDLDRLVEVVRRITR